MELKELDPRGLIADAFAIEGITAGECRSIFLDWALGVGQGQDAQKIVPDLIAHYAPRVAADHPMMVTLQAALVDVRPPRRRGGRASRV